MVKMKRRIIVIVVLAVCSFILYGQLEFNKIHIDNNEIKLLFLNDNIFFVYRFKINKLINEKIFDYKVYDIDNDGNDEILAISKSNDNKFGSNIIIYDVDINRNFLYAQEIYNEDFSEIKPWKIDVCNLDNDGHADIFIGVNKDTMFYKDVRNRPFFYTWDDNKLYKKWEGSFFTDWDLVDITFGDYLNFGRDIAAILERNEEGIFRVGLYGFTGFGFLNISNSVEYKNIKNIKTISYDDYSEIKLESKFSLKIIDVIFNN